MSGLTYIIQSVIWGCFIKSHHNLPSWLQSNSIKSNSVRVLELTEKVESFPEQLDFLSPVVENSFFPPSKIQNCFTRLSREWTGLQNLSTQERTPTTRRFYFRNLKRFFEIWNVCYRLLAGPEKHGKYCSDRLWILYLKCFVISQITWNSVFAFSVKALQAYTRWVAIPSFCVHFGGFLPIFRGFFTTPGNCMCFGDYLLWHWSECPNIDVFL